MLHVWCAGKILQDLVGRTDGEKPLGTPRHRREDNIKMDLQGVGWGGWTELIGLRIGTGDGHSYMRDWNFGFHKIRGIS